MKLDGQRFAIAVANVWAASGLLCAILYKLAPDTYARGANFLLHTDMYKPSRVPGWGELILAVVAWWLLAAILAGASAMVYNRSLGSGHRRTRPAPASSVAPRVTE